MKITKSFLYVISFLFFADCASSAAKSNNRTALSTGSAQAGNYSKVVKGSGKASNAAISKGSSVLSRVQCTEAARMNAMASAYPGRTNFTGVTVLECRETSENFASCECDVGFKD